MTNWIAANLVTWIFDISNLKNVVENTKSGYIYKTTFNNVATSKMGLDVLFPDSQVNGGIVVAIILAIIVFIILTRTTFGYQLKACGSNRLCRIAMRHQGQAQHRAFHGHCGFAGGCGRFSVLFERQHGILLVYLPEPSRCGFNGIPVALLAANHPIGVIFTGMFMSMLDIAGLQMTNLTAYNEYITDVIIAVIVYLSAFSLLIKTLLGHHRAHKTEAPLKDPGPMIRIPKRKERRRRRHDGNIV